jgi:hypothetical protein
MFKQFNDMATTFLARMEQTFPNEPKIKVYRHQFALVQGVNSRKPVEMFMQNMYDYGEQILSKDEKFFKQDQFVNTAESISGKMGLTQYWDSMTPQTKNAIWEYMTGLYILGMGSLGKQQELQEMIKKTGFVG